MTIKIVLTGRTETVNVTPGTSVEDALKLASIDRTGFSTFLNDVKLDNPAESKVEDGDRVGLFKKDSNG